MLKKCLTIWVAILIIVLIVPSEVISTSKGIVVISMDDTQEDWLEDISVKLMELHISKKMPVVVGVIPHLLDMPGGTLKDHLKKFYNEPMVEIAQHGYDHNEYLERISYEEQKNVIERGLKILLSLEIEPKTFIPPFGSADSTTVRVLNELGFHTLVNPIQDLQSEELTIISPLGVALCKENEVGYVCDFKSAEKLMKEIDQVIEKKGVVSIWYHMQDVSTVDNEMNHTKFNQLSILFDELKNSNKYNFMTAEKYHEFSTKNSINTSTTSSIISNTTTAPVTSTSTSISIPTSTSTSISIPTSTSTSISIPPYVFFIIQLIILILCIIILIKTHPNYIFGKKKSKGYKYKYKRLYKVVGAINAR